MLLAIGLALLGASMLAVMSLRRPTVQ